MDLTFLTDYIVLAVLGFCLCIGYVIKHSLDFIPNKFIPLIMLFLGAVVNVLINMHNIDINVVLGGMFSGLASTGLYEAFRNLIEKDGK